MPLLALATNRLLSLINNYKIWQHGLLFSGNRSEVMGTVICTRQFLKGLDFLNRLVQINTVGSHRIH